MKAGMKRPLLVCPPHKDYKNSSMVAALGALQVLYMVRKGSSGAGTRAFILLLNKQRVLNVSSNSHCLFCDMYEVFIY